MNGFPRLIDISDPKNPQVVGKLLIEMLGEIRLLSPAS